MIKITYNLPKNKNTYTVNFRHPVIKDKSKKYGLKIHRSLGTDNEDEANRLIEQLTKLANDEYWWDRSKRQEAYGNFSEIVVDAFFDCMDINRNQETYYLDKIFLPGKEQGFVRALILGPSGVGKTSLLRNMAGTTREKFPTTSTGRTTTCNTELIMSNDGIYEVVITFMPRALVEMYVQECIEAAIEYCLEQHCIEIDPQKVSEKLLIHRDLLVRLSYILGDLSLKASDKEMDMDFETDIQDDEETDAYEYQQDTDKLLAVIHDFIERVQQISKNLFDNEISLEDTECNLEDIDDVLQLRDDIVNEIGKRFNLLSKGEKLNAKGKWVNAWYFKTNQRDQFIRIIKMFSSNSKISWGGLLTPIVETMRIKGNFKPESINEQCKMVLFDGQGLGHKTTATSLSNETINYFKMSDAVILVDNAQAPMLENVKMALKATIEYGFAKKMVIAYTHVDLMNGANLTNFQDKKNHILIALDSYLSDLKKNNSYIFSEIEATAIQNATFFFSGLDKKDTSKMTKHYMDCLINHLKQLLTTSITPSDVQLTYNAMTLIKHLKCSLASYRQNWGEIIGYPYKCLNTEHWTRIKALSRRLAYFNQDHYNYELMPLADLRQTIAMELNIFLNMPLDIVPEESSEEVRVALISEIKNALNNKIADFITEKMWKNTEQSKRWTEAYNFTGKDSTYFRAAKINEIFEFGAPRIAQFTYDMTDIQKRYVMNMIGIVESTLNEYNAKLEKFEL